MADLPYSQIKINDVEVSADAPVTEALHAKLGGAVNYLLDRGLKYDVFTSSGNWTCPDGVTKIQAIGIGGGGAGGAKGATYSPGGVNVYTPGAGGNSGEFGSLILDVVPTIIYPVTIGSGGLGVNNGNGASGGNTTFGSTGVWRGGGGGYTGLGVNYLSDSIQSNQGNEISTGAISPRTFAVSPRLVSPLQWSGGWCGTKVGLAPLQSTGSLRESGQRAYAHSGGTAGTDTSIILFSQYEGGGGGAASPFGPGGNAGNGSSTPSAGSGTSALATSYGAGGGGAGGIPSGTNKGGDGATGILIIAYYGV